MLFGPLQVLIGVNRLFTLMSASSNAASIKDASHSRLRAILKEGRRKEEGGRRKEEGRNDDKTVLVLVDGGGVWKDLWSARGREEG